MVRDMVRIEWRTNDKWYGVQQEIRRKDINPDGPLDIGQKVRVKFGRGRHDAVVLESWKTDTRSRLPTFFSFPFVGICRLSEIPKRRLSYRKIKGVQKITNKRRPFGLFCK